MFAETIHFEKVAISKKCHFIVSLSTDFTPVLTVTDVFQRLRPIPVSRLRSIIGKDMATVEDVISIHDREKRLYELVDGLLVEKTMGSYESMIAIELTLILGSLIREHNLERVLEEAGMIRLNPDLGFVFKLVFT